MFRRFSSVGSCGINFCTTRLNACTRENKGGSTHKNLTRASDCTIYKVGPIYCTVPRRWSGHKWRWDKSWGECLRGLHRLSHPWLFGGCLFEPLHTKAKQTYLARSTKTAWKKGYSCSLLNHEQSLSLSISPDSSPSFRSSVKPSTLWMNTSNLMLWLTCERKEGNASHVQLGKTNSFLSYIKYQHAC